MSTLRHLGPVPDDPSGTEEEPRHMSIRELREAGARAGWNAEQVAEQLGISRTRLFVLQRNGNRVPDQLSEAAQRLLVLAEVEEQRLCRAEEALTMTLAAWNPSVREWVRSMIEEGTRSAATIEAYRLHVSWLAGDLAKRTPNPWAVQAHVLEDWIDSHNWSAETRRKVLVSLRAFYSWALLCGHIQRSPVAGITTAPPRKPGPQRYECPPAWADPLRKWQEYLHAGGRSPGTRKVYATIVTTLAADHADPWQVTLEDLARHLSRGDWSPAYRRSIRNVLRGFYSWAEDTGVLPAETPNPTARIPVVKVRRSMPRPAPDDAVLKALEKADHRTYLLLNVALYTGMRRTEIARLHTDDIGTDALLVHGKGGHERLVPLHHDLDTLLRAELRRRRERTELLSGWGPEFPPVEGWLFPSTYGQTRGEDRHLSPGHVGKLIAEALPKGWTTHTLRHRFATQAYRSQRDLRAVQELLGHSKPETTAIYAAVPGESLRNAISNVGPVTREWDRP